MTIVFLSITSIDQDVVQIDNHELSHNLHEDLIHKVLEDCWGIDQSKEHDTILVMSTLCDEGGLSSIS